MRPPVPETGALPTAPHPDNIFLDELHNFFKSVPPRIYVVPTVRFFLTQDLMRSSQRNKLYIMYKKIQEYFHTLLLFSKIFLFLNEYGIDF